MKSKKQKVLTKKKLSPFRIFLIFSLALLILIVGGTYLYVSELDNSTVSKFFDSLLVDKSIKDKPVKDMITYTLPEGWIEDTETPYLKESGAILLKSGDYKENSTQWDRDGIGVEIYLDVTPKYRFETIGTQRRAWSSNSFSSETKVLDISIDEVPGLKYEFSYKDSYTLEYFFVKDKYTVKIYVNNVNRTDIDEKYWKDINTVLDSVHFK